MKIYLTAIALMLVTACATLEKVGDFANGNPIVASAVVRQAVARYVDAGDTREDQKARASAVRDVLELTRAQLAGSPRSTVSEIMNTLESYIAWDSMSPADEMLARDVLMVVQLQLAQKQKGGELSEDAMIGIRALLQTAISAAGLLE